jgi:uncharacterized protein (DUF1697 family)
MKYAVFFRNVNLGRPKSPVKAQLERAFLEAGASDAQSFLTNGTIVFTIKAGVSASKTLAVASKQLQKECGLIEPGFLRPMAHLESLVAMGPFAAVDMDTIYSCNATFLHAKADSRPGVPLFSARKDVEVLLFTESEAMSISRKIGNTAGSPNAFLEKLFAQPATTRNWNTIVRLVAKHA